MCFFKFSIFILCVRNTLLLLFSSGCLLRLGQKRFVNIGDNTAARDVTPEKPVELLIPPDSKSDVPRGNPVLLVVTGRVARNLKNLGGEVLHDSSKVHGGTSTDTGGNPDLLHVSVDTTDGEYKSSTRGTGFDSCLVGGILGLGLGLGLGIVCHFKI